VIGFKKYTILKNSGILWVGDIPDHWEVKKFKHFYASSMGNTILKEDLSDEATIPVYSATEYVEILGYIDNPNVLLHREDFIIPARGNSIGHVKLVEDKCTCTQTTIYARRRYPGRINSSFVYWYQIGLRKKLYEYNNTAIPQLTVRQVKDNPILVPSMDEQRMISTFLDQETARIDALIQKKERMIELLKEKRIALITQAVTKGLDPNVPMKESGIEWLGEVPEHWEVKKLKYLGKSLIGLTYSPEEIVFEDGTLVLRASNIQNSTLSLGRDDDVSVVTKIPNELMVVEDDILICSRNGSKALIGKAAIIGSDVNATFGAFMTVFRSRFNRFIIWVLHSSMFSSLCSGYVTSTINQLTQDDLNNIAIPLPPDNELKEITKHLEKESYFIDKLIIKADRSISLLREYRASLIYHAVTGKIDLRDYDAQVQ
jgi:type I restriction enzyme S subunit